MTTGFETNAWPTEGVLGRRILGWAIDSVILGIGITILWVVLFVFGIATFGLGVPLLGTLWVVPTLYTFLCVASSAQATPGQTVAGLRVVREEDGGRPNQAQAAVFAVGYWLTMAAGVVLLAAALVTRGGRCLHDIVAGVVVVPAASISLPGWNRGGLPRA